MIYMNKKTTLLGVLGLAVVSGAGYLYTSGQASQLPQQIGQYLPEVVRDYLPASFSPQSAASEQVVETDEAEPIDDQVVDTEIPIAEESMEEMNANDANMALSENSDETSKINVSSEEFVEGETDNEAGLADINSDIVDEIEQPVSQLDETIEKNTESPIVDVQVTREIQELEQQLSEVNSQLGGLDSEKLELEDKFQNVLKQNRALAAKLEEIDQQLKINMK